MRFIFLTLGYTPDLDGGGYRYATEVAERLAHRGHEVHAIYPNPDGTLPETDFRNGVHLHRVSRSGSGFFTRWRTANAGARNCVATLLQKPSRTLLLSHHAYMSPSVKGLRHCIFLHGPWALEHRLSVTAKPRGLRRRIVDRFSGLVMHRIERGSIARASRVLVASEYSRGRIPSWHRGLNCEVEVVGGGADLVRFVPANDRESVRRNRGVLPDEFLFLAVRRLDPRMGLLHLIEAFQPVARQFPRARLAIAGRGPQREELLARAQDLGLGDRVHLLGFVPEAELHRLYQSADCVLMPSLDLEGFGLATAEALACGTPVLASSSGANPELIRPLGEDLLFEARNPEALSRTMVGVLSGGIRLPTRDRCAVYAREAFRWDKPADAIEKAALTAALPQE
ncbi:MAG: glycosyltransferase family 4 protein [Verrucomicrobia bacterium]|nr:glycosyltransferase family 4 protein [Verrucomicrobiota bacterium]